MGYYLGEDWRWYQNDTAEPTTALASQNISAASNNYAILRGRFGVRGLPNFDYVLGWYKNNKLSDDGYLLNTASASPLYDNLPNLANFNGSIALGDFYDCGNGQGYASGAASYNMSGAPTCGGFYNVNNWLPYYVARLPFLMYGPAGGVGFPNGYYADVQSVAGWAGAVSKVYAYLNKVQTNNKWIFSFTTNKFDHPVANMHGTVDVHVVLEDGTKVDGNVGVGWYGYELYDYERMGMGREKYSSEFISWHGLIGDVIIYHPDQEMLIADWANWYDALRGRYDMSARSGW